MVVQPLDNKGRVASLDIIRGIAVLGILIMNIQSFSMVQAAYTNPMAFGDLSGVNFWVYYLSHVFADQKFMTIFSLLFGVGIVLMSSNIESKGGDAKKIHYRRMSILAVVGLLHSFILWWGDILFAYAIAGMIAYRSKELSPSALITKGVICIALCSAILALFGVGITFLQGEELNDMLAMWQPTSAQISTEIAQYKLGWLEQSSYRANMTLEMIGAIFFYLFRVVGLMYIGMALYKLQFFSEGLTLRALKLHAVISIALGLTLTIFGSVINFNADWPINGMFLTSQFNYWGSLAMAYGYLCLLMLFCKNATFLSVKTAFANIGRMALTNYLLQSIICCFVFYGWGLGLFGELERAQQFILVVAIWLVIAVFSNMWMSRFKFGPFEWAWRSLTYKKAQSIRLPSYP